MAGFGRCDTVRSEDVCPDHTAAAAATAEHGRGANGRHGPNKGYARRMDHWVHGGRLLFDHAQPLLLLLKCGGAHIRPSDSVTDKKQMSSGDRSGLRAMGNVCNEYCMCATKC